MLSGLLIVAASSANALDLRDHFHNQIRTQHFDFRFNGDVAPIAEIADFAEGFLQVVQRDYLDVSLDSTLLVAVLPNKERFHGFLTRQLGIGNLPDHALYLPQRNMFLTYQNADLGIFAHEIMHPLVERHLPARPRWAIEGIPSYFENFYGYRENGELRLQFGYQSPWRIESLDDDLLRIRLGQTVKKRAIRFHNSQSEFRMVVMFMTEEGVFHRFLDLIRSNDKRGYKTFVEASFDQPMAKLERRWESYLYDVAQRRAGIRALPPSRVFASRALFESAVSGLDFKAEHLAADR